MRNRMLGLISALALPSTLATAGCADYSGGNGAGGSASVAGGGSAATGGSSSNGGTSSTGGGQVSTGGSAATATGGSSSTSSCTSVTPCGGSLEGTWTATSATCLTLSGQLDLKPIGTGCTSAAITDGTVQVTGSITFTADSYTDNTSTTLSEHFKLDHSCLNISGTTTDCAGISPPLKGLGFTTVTCTTNGTGCDCTGTLSQGTQTGGLGIMNTNASDTGNYTTSGNTLTMTPDGRNNFVYQYCVSGSTLTANPQSTNQTTSGSITFSKS